MKTTYILFILMNATTAPPHTQEFNDRKSCEYAREMVKEIHKSWDRFVSAFCVPKGE